MEGQIGQLAKWEVKQVGGETVLSIKLEDKALLELLIAKVGPTGIVGEILKAAESLIPVSGA